MLCMLGGRSRIELSAKLQFRQNCAHACRSLFDNAFGLERRIIRIQKFWEVLQKIPQFQYYFGASRLKKIIRSRKKKKLGLFETNASLVSSYSGFILARTPTVQEYGIT